MYHSLRSPIYNVFPYLIYASTYSYFVLKHLKLKRLSPLPTLLLFPSTFYDEKIKYIEKLKELHSEHPYTHHSDSRISTLFALSPFHPFIHLFMHFKSGC